MSADEPVIASFSGGRSSAAMIIEMIKRGKPPDRTVFCNTGMETLQTLDFAWAFAEHILAPANIPFHCLEYCRHPITKNRFREVKSRDECDIKGAVFFDFIQQIKMIPNQSRRFCTAELKVETKIRFLRSIGITDFITAVGFRADEPRRTARMRQSNEVLEAKNAQGKRNRGGENYKIAPLEKYGIDKAGVMAIIMRLDDWAAVAKTQARLSNCYGCFFSTWKEKLEVCRERPDLAAQWQMFEEWVRDYKARNNRPKVKENEHRIFEATVFNRELPPDQEMMTFYNIASWQQIRRFAAGEGNNSLGFADWDDEKVGCDSGGCFTDL